jgi:hypothetical protein
LDSTWKFNNVTFGKWKIKISQKLNYHWQSELSVLVRAVLRSSRAPGSLLFAPPGQAQEQKINVKRRHRWKWPYGKIFTRRTSASDFSFFISGPHTNLQVCYFPNIFLCLLPDLFSWYAKFSVHFLSINVVFKENSNDASN